MFLPALPNVPGAGKAKATVLNHCSVVEFESSGFPIRLGRSLAPKPRIDRPVPLLSISESSATVNGRPDCSATMPNVSHPLKTVESQPSSATYSRPFPNGNAYV